MTGGPGPLLINPFTGPLVYRVTQEIEFCYGHRLLNYGGKCRHLHGHNARARIVMEGDRLDSRGMLVDFTEIKQAVRSWVDENLDHRMLLGEHDPALKALKDLNEPVYVLRDNPTAENIARLIYDFAHRQGFPVVEVSLWETPYSFATYRGGE